MAAGDTQYYLTVLKRELSVRCERNPKYSLRAFAKAQEVDVAPLSRALAGVKPLPIPTAKKLAANLALGPEEAARFMESVVGHHANLKVVSEPNGANASYKEIEQDSFKVISDWYHYAILELTHCKGFKDDARWIARTLGISHIEAALALDRLNCLGLLIRRAGATVKSDKNITIQNKEKTTPAIRKMQRQILLKAIDSLENDPIEERNMSSMTFAIDPDKLPQAKRMITAFIRELSDYLEVGAKRRVYNLSVSLYPIQRKENGT